MFKCLVRVLSHNEDGQVKRTGQDQKTSERSERGHERAKGSGREAQEQKKMLGYLKYMQVKNDATPEQREDAANGLRIYQGLKADKKGPFLDRWKATKDNKSTQWMKTFEEELQKDKIVERNTLRGLYTRQFPPMHLCNCVLVCSHL